MARLLLINGLPGSGKSTLAQRYADGHALAFVLDIDVLLAQLGQWQQRQDMSWSVAERLAAVLARQHLGDGYDVVVPHYFGTSTGVLQLEALGREVGAEFVEIVVRDGSPAEASRRFRHRSANPQTPQHLSAPLGLPEQGSVAEFTRMHGQLEEMIRQRPGMTIIEPVLDDIDATYAALIAVLSHPER